VFSNENTVKIKSYQPKNGYKQVEIAKFSNISSSAVSKIVGVKSGNL